MAIGKNLRYKNPDNRALTDCMGSDERENVENYPVLLFEKPAGDQAKPLPTVPSVPMPWARTIRLQQIFHLL
jgi:hypothetical protein